MPQTRWAVFASMEWNLVECDREPTNQNPLIPQCGKDKLSSWIAKKGLLKVYGRISSQWENQALAKTYHKGQVKKVGCTIGIFE